MSEPGAGDDMSEGDEGLPGVPLASGFDYRLVSEFPALHLTREEMADWQAWLDEVKRARLRAMESAATYVIG